ncbi:hypothetical protein AB6A40_006395 [Gnathostoma spinigerum]|uniref:Uncharacterized protein n=1 Tax=Gnathostoma spinigerum TaxID=75299 RepID=A0ABD6EIW8_9BILA
MNSTVPHSVTRPTTDCCDHVRFSPSDRKNMLSGLSRNPLKIFDRPTASYLPIDDFKMIPLFDYSLPQRQGRSIYVVLNGEAPQMKGNTLYCVFRLRYAVKWKDYRIGFLKSADINGEINDRLEND